MIVTSDALPTKEQTATLRSLMMTVLVVTGSHTSIPLTTKSSDEGSTTVPGQGVPELLSFDN